MFKYEIQCKKSKDDMAYNVFDDSDTHIAVVTIKGNLLDVRCFKNGEYLDIITNQRIDRLLIDVILFSNNAIEHFFNSKKEVIVFYETLTGKVVRDDLLFVMNGDVYQNNGKCYESHHSVVDFDNFINARIDLNWKIKKKQY